MAWTFVMNTGYCWLVWKNKRINIFVGLFVLSWPHSASVSAEYKAVTLAEYSVSAESTLPFSAAHSVSAESEIYRFGRPLVFAVGYNAIASLAGELTKIIIIFCCSHLSLVLLTAVAFAQLMQSMWTAQDFVSPTAFKSEVSQFARRFGGYR